jgi:hypothetical protein
LKTIIIILIAVFTMWGCSHASTPATGQQATVTLGDGSTFTGTVTSSSTSAISLQGSTGESRTYPMSQVASVQYIQTPQYTQTPPPAGSTPSASSAPPAPQPPAPVAPPLVASPPVATSAAAPPPQAAPTQPIAEFRTIPSGTTIQVRNNDPIDSDTAQVGQTFSGVVEQEVVDTNGGVAIPRGAAATLVVRSASGQGKLQGRSDLAVDVSSVNVRGKTYRMETSDFEAQGKEGVGTNKRTGVFAGGGAALGGIIGAIAGGGKGAAIGALSGAGGGTAAQALSRGKAVRIPSETLLSFKLEAPVRIHEMR